MRLKPILLALLLLPVLLLSACSGADPSPSATGPAPSTAPSAAPTPTDDDSSNTIEYQDNGLSLTLPDDWTDQLYRSSANLRISTADKRVDLEYVPDAALALMDQAMAPDLTDDQYQKLADQAWALTLCMATILTVKTEEVNTDPVAIETRKSFTHEEPIGEHAGYTYTFHYNDSYDESNLQQDEKELLGKLLVSLPAIKNGVVMLDRPEPTEGTITFAATTLDGQDLDSTYFSNYSLTMVVLWATWAQESVALLPTLAELQTQLPDGVSLLGVVTDVDDVGQLQEQALALAQAAGGFYPILMNNHTMFSMTDKANAFPTLLFYNQSGDIVGEPIVPSSATVTDLLGYIAEHRAQG